MFDNIKKLITYVLAHTFPELWALFVHYLFGMPIAITTLQILSIDLVTEILPGIALCKEPLEGDVMKRPPRKAGTILIGKALIGYVYGYIGHMQTAACFLAYMSVFWSYGFGMGDLWMSKGYFRSDYDHPDAKGLMNFTITSGGQRHTYSPVEQDAIAREARSAWHIGSL